jgi:hypothetical protein
MFSPSFTFGLLLGALCGGVVHLIFGGGGRSLLLYVVAAWVGFAIGQPVGKMMGIHFAVVGLTNVLTGVVGALLTAGVMVFLTWQRAPHATTRS